MDGLIAEAGRRGIRILLDLVPDHVSDRHAWFRDALTGREAAHRDFCVRADPAPHGGPPNDWISNRDDCRTPMVCDESPPEGTWLPFGSPERDVAARREDAGSVLHLVRADLRTGANETVDGPGRVFRRGDGTVAALHLSDREVAVDVPGTVLISTGRSLDGAALTGLGPWQGAVAGS